MNNAEESFLINSFKLETAGGIRDERCLSI
jgi:hypothetical protein